MISGGNNMKIKNIFILIIIITFVFGFNFCYAVELNMTDDSRKTKKIIDIFPDIIKNELLKLA